MAEIGRWGVVDPHSNSYFSFPPFVYCVGNPLNFVDPDGKDVIFSLDRNKKGEITGIRISSTIHITGVGATQSRADELNAASKDNFKSRTVNGVNIGFDINYKYSKSIASKDLKKGENVLNFANIVSTKSNRSGVFGYRSEITENGVTTYNNLAGRFGQINKDAWDDNRTIFHESLHFTGIGDKYYEHGQYDGVQNSFKGFENDIMGGNTSRKIGYDHYNAYYLWATHPRIPNHSRWFLSRGVIDKNIPQPSKQQISEQ